MNETIEIVYCGWHKMDNKVAADLQGKKLRKPYQLKSFSSLELMASYLKNENHGAQGVVAFRKNGVIMSSGVNVISNFNLFITGAFRMNLRDEWRMKDIPILRDHLSKQKFHDFKDYFVVTSGHGFLQEIDIDRKEDWQTLLVMENVDPSKIVKIDDAISKSNLSLSNFKTQGKYLYVEVKCHFFYLSDFLTGLKRSQVNAKVLGTYKLQ